MLIEEFVLSALSGPTPVQFVYQPPPSWLQLSTQAPLHEVKESTVEEITLTQGVNLGNTHLRLRWWVWSSCRVTCSTCVSHTVDNDPHFIIHLPGRSMTVCFNVDSKPGDVLSLVSDEGTGETLQKFSHRDFFKISQFFLRFESKCVLVSTPVTWASSFPVFLVSWRCRGERSVNRLKEGPQKQTQNLLWRHLSLLPASRSQRDGRHWPHHPDWRQEQ